MPLKFQERRTTRQEQYRARNKRAQQDPEKLQKLRKQKNESDKRAKTDPSKYANICRSTRECMRRSRAESKNEQKKKQPKEWPPIINDEIIKQCIDEFKDYTSSRALSFKCCAVCGIESHTTKMMKIENIPNSHLLKPDEDDISLEEYKHFGITLVKNGIQGTKVTCCDECLGYLKRKKLPPNSAANGLQYGATPNELKDLKIGEKLLIGIIRPSVHVIKFKEIAGPGTGQKGLKGNSICFPQNMETITSAVYSNTLPHNVESLCDSMKVVFTGAHRPTRQQLHNVLEVRRQKVSDALVWLKNNHHLYKDVHIDQARLLNIPANSIPECIWHTIDYEEIGESDAKPSKTCTNTSIDDILSEVDDSIEKVQNDEIIVETTGMIDILGSSVSTEEQSQSAASQILEGYKEENEERIHIIPHGSAPIVEYCNPDLWTGAYPWLFPYGIGGAECKRRAPLSLRSWIKLLMLQFDSKFRDDITFFVHVFNVIQKREVSLQTALCLRHPKFSQMSKEINTVTSDKLEKALVCIAKGQQTDPEIQSLLRQIHVVGGKIPGTPYSKRVSRQEIQGLMVNQGMPAFWVTLNPADIHAPIVSFLAGHEIDLDAQFPEMPSPHQRARIAAEHPVSCARYFDLVVLAFINCLLRYKKKGGGILGNVSAYYGCPEEQGRGALHIHMLVWIEGYTSPTELRRLMSEDPDFKARFLAYLEQVIRQHSPFADEFTPDENVNGNIDKDMENMASDGAEIHTEIKESINFACESDGMEISDVDLSDTSDSSSEATESEFSETESENESDSLSEMDNVVSSSDSENESSKGSKCTHSSDSDSEMEEKDVSSSASSEDAEMEFSDTSTESEESTCYWNGDSSNSDYEMDNMVVSSRASESESCKSSTCTNSSNSDSELEEKDASSSASSEDAKMEFSDTSTESEESTYSWNGDSSNSDYEMDNMVVSSRASESESCKSSTSTNSSNSDSDLEEKDASRSASSEDAKMEFSDTSTERSEGMCSWNGDSSDSDSDLDVESESSNKDDAICDRIEKNTIGAREEKCVGKDKILTSRPIDTRSPNFKHELDLHIAQLIPYCCIHRHNLSCYKFGDHKTCRYDYPRKIVTETVLDDEGIKIKRLHQWINNYECTTLECIKSNMDIQFIGSGKACKSAAFYMCNYQTKSGLTTHNILSIIKISIKKMDVNQHTDATLRSRALVVKCVNRSISEREMSAPHIASLLLGGEDKYTSHSFKTLNLLSFLSRITSDDEEPRIERQSLIQKGQSGIVLWNECNDYMLRGDDLSGMSLYQYTSTIEKITKKSDKKLKSKKDGKTGRPPNRRYEFDADHQQSSTHIQKERSVKLVPRLTYLPPSPDGSPEKYAQCMLILFKPFTNIENLKEKSQTWMEAFQSYQFDEEHNKWISNIQEMHDGLAEKSQLDEERRLASPEDYEGLTDDECYFLSEDEEFETGSDEVFHSTHLDDMDQQTMEAADIMCSAKGFNNSNAESITLCQSRDRCASKITIKKWKSHLEDSKKAVKDECQHDTMELKPCFSLSDAMLNFPVCDEITRIPGADVIQEVSKQFDLNHKQAHAFQLIANNVIKRMNGEPTKQILMYIGGAGGTGKTRVIKAIEHLHDRLGVRFALKLAAYTGTAAAEIGGNTLCSLAHLSRTMNAKLDVQKLEQTWKYVTLLVIDEASMISSPMLARLHRNLIHAKHDISNAPFANIDLVNVGDFNQHPPIKSPALYIGTDPDTETEEIYRQSDIDKECGKTLWHQLTHVVLLTEQHRVEDKQYSEMLSRIAEGRGTLNDYFTLNTRLISNIDMQQERFLNAPIVVPGNQLRMKMNRIHASHHAVKLQQKLLISVAMDTCVRHPLPASKLQQLQRLSYTRTSNLPGELELFRGMPVMVTKNIAVEFKISNGAIGVISKIVCIGKPTLSAGLYILPDIPIYVVVKFPDTTCPAFPGLASGEIPIFPQTDSFQFKFPGTTSSSTIRRRQLPLISCYSYTSHKAQGKTLPAIVTDLVPLKKNVDCSFAYVPLSRIRHLEDLVIIRPFPISVIQSKRPKDLIAQDAKFIKMDSICSN